MINCATKGVKCFGVGWSCEMLEWRAVGVLPGGSEGNHELKICFLYHCELQLLFYMSGSVESVGILSPAVSC